MRMLTPFRLVYSLFVIFLVNGCDDSPMEPNVGSSQPLLSIPGIQTVSTTGIQMRDLGVGCIPRDMNNTGLAVGWHISGGSGHACILDKGTTIDLGSFGGRSSNARAVNQNGQVVVYVQTGARQEARLWADGTSESLAPIVVATDVNARGQVVGRTSGFPSGFRGLLWDRGTVTDLVNLDGGATFPFAINDLGQVVGYSGSPFGPHHAFLWTDGVMTDLGSMNSGWSSEAVAINNRGDVVVEDIDFSQTPVRRRAWLYSQGTATDLGSLGAGRTSASDINNRGQIVGDYSQNRAWLWENGELTDLGHLPGSNASVASTIDDAGRVMGVSGGRVVIWLP